eukprot:UN24031
MAGCYGGNLLAGSIIYTVVYSSVTLWTAVLSIIFLKRRLTLGQWIGCVLVTAGIGVTAFQSSELGKSVFVGTMLLLGGTALHSFSYILSDYLFNLPNPVPEDLLCSLNGIGGLILYMIWICAYTIPRWQEL